MVNSIAPRSRFDPKKTIALDSRERTRIENLYCLTSVLKDDYFMFKETLAWSFESLLFIYLLIKDLLRQIFFFHAKFLRKQRTELGKSTGRQIDLVVTAFKQPLLIQ